MVRSILSKVLLLGIVLITTILEAQPHPSPPLNTYIVQVTKDSNPGQVGRGIVQRTRGKLGHVYTSAVKGFSVQLPPGLDERVLKAQSGVLLVEPDVSVHTVAQTLPTGVDRIEADNSGVTTPVDVDIAIIDTGIDIDHPDLNVVGGRHFYSLWGLISFENDQYDDDNGHGSHCAGIAAAKSNYEGVVGVAPGARLWSVKVLDSTGSGYLSDVIAGIDWVTAHADEIEIENMSLAATASSSIFRTAIQNTVNAGVVCVVAAGNDSKDIYGLDGIFGTSDDVIPAAYPEAATISAMVDLDGIPGGEGGSHQYGYDDSFANFSNDSHSVVAGNPVTSPGKAIDLLMPGVNILSCYMNGGYAIGSGTSMASPHAAGLVALYIAWNGRATNASEVYTIRQALIDGGVAQDDPEWGLYLSNDFDGNHENIGWAGSTEVPGDDPPSITVTYPTDGAIIYGSCDIIADASDDYGVAQVEFFVDDEFIGSDTNGDDGWSVFWDTTAVPDGDHTVNAIATDTIGQTSENWIGVTVDNSTDDPPSVIITNPTDGATIYGSGDIIADASDDYGVTQVEFFVDEEFIGSDTNGNDGWSVFWDTTAVPDGDHTVSAIATDTIGQTSENWIGVTVDNSTDELPNITITNPADRAIVSGYVDVIADASDDYGVTQVEFFVDDEFIGSDTNGDDGWSVSWDTTIYSNSAHILGAIVADTTEQTASHSIEVFVDNSQESRIAQVNVTAMPLLSTRRFWVATAMVTVTEDGFPVAGATIEGVWSGLYKKSASNMTDIFGFISFETGLLRKAGTVTFTVTKVIAPNGQEYVLDPLEPGDSTTGP